jgi:indolepyruvate ferredoxin oxidoreductase alpha subunit
VSNVDIEPAIAAALYRAGADTVLAGKGPLPIAGEYTGEVMLAGLGEFLRTHAPDLLAPEVRAPNRPAPPDLSDLAKSVPPRPPGFCIGCPERPIFAATKLVEQELGPHHIASDIGCHLFSIMPPFELGATTMGYGLGPASASAFNAPDAKRRSISFVGDGGFWHNGLTSSIGNAVFNRNDGVIVIVDNHYSAATGGQDILSSRASNKSKSTKHPIAEAVKGMGVKWVRQVDHTYDVGRMRATLTEALTTSETGPKVIVASSECMLNRQRREAPALRSATEAGRRTTRIRFGVDEDVCTGDHACMRLSGCPSLTVKTLDDPLRDDPVAHIDQNCVGCGNCGEVADAAVLCPSFYEARITSNPNAWDRFASRWHGRFIARLQARREAGSLTFTAAAP